MFKKLFIVLIICLFTTPIYAQTQSEMIEFAINRSKVENEKLNKIYQSILVDFSDDKNFIENLKKSQNAWEKYKEAQVSALFPEKGEDIVYNYGSNYEIYYYSYIYDLIKLRISELKKLADLRSLYVVPKAHSFNSLILPKGSQPCNSYPSTHEKLFSKK